MKWVSARWRLLVAVLLVLGALGAAAYFYFQPRHAVVVVTRTATGFVPSKVYLNKGDAVEFVSTTGEQFWPASDNHPSHTLYPAFDPKRPLAPTERWQFRFDNPGVWGFHDHLHSDVRGTIIVRGTLGEATSACLATRQADGLNPVCWEADVKNLMETKGLDAALNYISQQYATNPLFKRNCHDVMHFVGSYAYQKFLTTHSYTDRPEAAYCGYGFYHGFIEAMQAANGRGQYGEVLAYCDSIIATAGPSAGGPCFHGIGHALFDSIDGKLYGNALGMVANALSSCEAALPGEGTRPHDRVQCASGVFNSFSNAASAKNYGLAPSDLDAHRICDAQRPEYQEVCYGEVGVGYIRNDNLDRNAALSFIENLHPQSLAKYMIFVYFADETKRAMTDFHASTLAQSCVSLPPDLQESCIYGVVEGIREETQPATAHTMQFPFCEAFSDSGLRTYCMRTTFSITSSDARSARDYQNACRAVLNIDSASVCQ